MGSRYIPDRGDLVWLNFSPQAGREQSGHRPGLILSPVSYNARSGLALVCPITSRQKGYPFEVALPQGLPVSGVALADHVRSLDWRERRLTLIGPAPRTFVEEVLARTRTLLL